MCPTSIAGLQDTSESEVVNISVDPDVLTISHGDCGINSETTISVETEDNSSFDSVTRKTRRERKNLRASVEATKNLIQIGQDQAKMQQWFYEKTVEIMERQTSIMERQTTAMKQMGADMAKMGTSIEQLGASIENIAASVEQRLK
ncbi:uncharacterized protein LOC123321605 [Coccinella septempunctata]|uniref:uncharacterized protein LOC123321605 n=1 Tax=Coccinella septempunctata TaxID=41139 RepID=UPI001D082282|nr:uncharacterized protein LOC123321605 [Coccinella septempunctata]